MIETFWLAIQHSFYLHALQVKCHELPVTMVTKLTCQEDWCDINKCYQQMCVGFD